MIDDAKVRQFILAAHPQIQPWKIEMEEIDFGEEVGVWLNVGDQLIIRTSVPARGKSEFEIAKELNEKIDERLAQAKKDAVSG